jgi:hypothetical protein
MSTNTIWNQKKGKILIGTHLIKKNCIAKRYKTRMIGIGFDFGAKTGRCPPRPPLGRREGGGDHTCRGQ